MKKHQFDARGMACPLPVVETKKLLQDNEVVETIVDNFIATQNLEKLAKQGNYNFDVKKISDKHYEVTIGNYEEKVIDTFSQGGCIIPVKRATKELETTTTVSLLVNAKKHVEDLEKFANKNGYKIEVENKDNEIYQVTIERPELEVVEQNSSKVDDSYIVVVNKKIMGHGSEELGSKLIKGFFYALSEQEVLPQKILFYNDGANLVDKSKSNVLEELRELENLGVEILCCGACIDYHKIDLAVGNPTNMYFMVEDMRKANRVVRP